jgi:hypothetical protein
VGGRLLGGGCAGGCQKGRQQEGGRREFHNGSVEILQNRCFNGTYRQPLINPLP